MEKNGIEDGELRRIEEYIQDYKKGIKKPQDDLLPDPPTYMWYRARSGEYFRFDISQSSLAHFSYNYGNRVQTVKGPATVIGLKTNYWWVHLDTDRGCSYWDNYNNFDDLKKYEVSSLPLNVNLSDELNIIKELPVIPPAKEETCFLISKKWFDKWRSYIEKLSEFGEEPKDKSWDKTNHPGRIDNFFLAQSLQIPSLKEACISSILKHKIDMEKVKLRVPNELMEFVEKCAQYRLDEFYHVYYFVRKKWIWQLQFKGLVEGEDYILLSEPMWRKLQSKYGGGPTFPIDL